MSDPSSNQSPELSQSLVNLANVIGAGISSFGIYDDDPVWAAQAARIVHAYMRDENRPMVEWTATSGWNGSPDTIRDLGLDKSGSHFQMVDAVKELTATLRNEESLIRRHTHFPQGLIILWDTEKFWDSGAFRYLIPTFDEALKAAKATAVFVLPSVIPPLYPMAAVLPQVAAGGDDRSRYGALLTGWCLDENLGDALAALHGIPVHVARAVVGLAQSISERAPELGQVGALQVAIHMLRPASGVTPGGP